MNFRLSAKRATLAATIALSVFGTTHFAKAVDWIGTTTNFNDAANWNGGLPVGTGATLNQSASGNNTVVMDTAFTFGGMITASGANSPTTPFNITGLGTLTATGTGNASNFASGSNQNFTVDVAVFNITGQSTIMTSGDWTSSAAEAGSGSLIFGHAGGGMAINYTGSTASKTVSLRANNVAGGTVGTSIIFYPKLDFTGVTSTTTSNAITLAPQSLGTIQLLGGITGGATPSAGNPSKLLQTNGVAGGKTILGDSSGWVGFVKINISDLEINSSNSLGTTAGFTEIASGTNKGALRLAGTNINTPETIYAYSRANADSPQIRNISGNNTLSGNVITDSSNAGFSVINSDGTAVGDLLTVQGNIMRTGSGSGDLILQGAGNGVVSGSIQKTGSGTWNSVTKNGGGTWTLSGANTYTGSTIVQQGTLSLGTTGNITTSSSISVLGGGGNIFDVSGKVGGYTLGSAQTLKGAGTVLGTINSGTGSAIAPGDAGIGTLTINNLSLSDTSTLQYELTSTPTSLGGVSDTINLLGNLTLGGSTILAVNQVNGSLGNGTYRLIDYTGSLTGDASNFTVSGVGGGIRQLYNFDTATAHQLNLVVTGPGTPSASLIWVGGGANPWDVVTTANWSGGTGGDNRFYAGDSVTFDDTGSNSPDVNIVGSVSPNQVTFTNSTGHDYKLIGGSISATGDLNVNGSGNVELNNIGTTINGSVANNGTGTLKFSNSGTFAINGFFVQANNGIIEFNLANNVTLSNIFLGSGIVQKENTNTLTLSADNSGFNGQFIVNNGTLVAGAASSLGIGQVTIGSNGAVDLNGKKNTSTIVTVGGTGFNGLGALVDFGATGTVDANRAQISGMEVTSDVLLATVAGSAPVITGSFIHGNGHSITLIGAGGWNFTDVGETSFANITVKEGVLNLLGSTTAGDQPGVITLENNGGLGVNNSTLSKNIVVSSAGSSKGYLVSVNANSTVTPQITMNGTFEAGVTNLDANTTKTLTLAGKLTGAGSFAVHLNSTSSSRAGVVEITSDDNDYLGSTTLGGGSALQGGTVANDRITLSIGNGGSTGALPAGSTVILNTDTNLRFNRNNDYIFPNVISGNGVVRQLGPSGTVTLSGNNTFTGPTLVLDNGNLEITHNNALGAFDGANYTEVVGGALTGALVLSNNITTPETIFLHGRASEAAQLINKSDNNTISTSVITDVDLTGPDGKTYTIQSDSGLLTLVQGIRSPTLAELSIAYGLGGSGTVIFKGNSNGAVGGITENDGRTLAVTKSGTGTWAISGTNNYTGATIVDGGLLDVSAGANIDTSATVTVSASGSLLTDRIRNGTVTIDGVATVRANGGVAGASKVETLSMTGTSKLNLKDNDLVVGSAANVTAVRDAIKLGKTNNAPSGITSDAALFGSKTGFGYAMGDDPNLSPLLTNSSLLTGQSFDTNSVLVKYTFLGDADLDGDTDLNDLGKWASNFTGDLNNPAVPAKFWTQGDFDYDGDTDLNDLGKWSSNFTGDLNGGAGSLIVYAPGASASAVAVLNGMGITVVPEPSTFILAGVGLAGLAIAARRRKK